MCSKGFTETKPVAGRSERDDLSTEVYISYDDLAVYVAACMHDVSRTVFTMN